MPTITGLKDQEEHAEHAAEQWETQADGYLRGVYLFQDEADEAERQAEVAKAEAESWRQRARGYRRLMGEYRHASLLAESGVGSLTVTCVDCGKTETASESNPELTMGVLAGRRYDEFPWPW
jgi:hypothetical protein